MEEKIKEIVSVFIRVPAGNISSATPVDRSAVQNSILLHRMYARLAEEGFEFGNYSTIKVFGDLLPAAVESTPNVAPASRVDPAPPIHGGPSDSHGDQPGVGIDIEAIANLPRVADFRTAEFYRMNFSAEEIAYCILQPDPYASFAGLFAVKEAIIKADEQYRNRQFSTLAIGHTDQGKPFFPGFGLSISHANEMAVAVAVRNGGTMLVQPAPVTPSINPPQKRTTSPIAWLALLLALAALLVTLLH